MEGTRKQDLFFLELRQRLETGLVVIRADFARSSADVDISAPDSSLLVKTGAQQLSVRLPKGVSVLPDSCREADGNPGEGLHLRLRLTVDRQTEPPGSVLKKLKVQESYCFSCQRCSQQLLVHRTFLRVLPLPTGNWNALIEDWCCHPDPFANKKLLPKQKDCLLGDTFFLLARDSDCEKHFIQECSSAAGVTNGSDSAQKTSRSETLRCASCQALLGEAIAADALKLYITEVVVRKSDDGDHASQHRWQFLQSTLAARLVEMSTTQSIFRFSVQTPEGKPRLLLWLLNTDSLIASLSETASSDAADTSRGRHHSCQAGRAVKVLYLVCNSGTHQEITDAWEKDAGVHPLILLHSTCQELLQLLDASTGSLPPSLRTMNSFQVAFMLL